MAGCIVLIFLLRLWVPDNFIMDCHWSMDHVWEALVYILLLEAELSRKLLLKAVAPDASPELLVWSLPDRLGALLTHPVSLTEIAVQRRVLHGDSLGYHNLLQWLTDEAQGLGRVIDVLCLHFSKPFISTLWTYSSIIWENKIHTQLSGWKIISQLWYRGQRAHRRVRHLELEFWLCQGQLCALGQSLHSLDLSFLIHKMGIVPLRLTQLSWVFKQPNSNFPFTHN